MAYTNSDLPSVAFFSNMPSHHTIPLGTAFARLLGSDKYSFVCWDKPLESRVKLGWPTEFDQDWLTVVGQSDALREKAHDIMRSADVVIWSYAPSDILTERVSQGKLTFRYTEPLFKRGHWTIIHPRKFRLVRLLMSLKGPAHHLLAVGPHSARDYHLIGTFPGRIWRWGYFTEAPTLDDYNRDPNRPLTLLWAGRMVKLKQVDMLLRAARWARDNCDIPFKIELVGDGPAAPTLRALAHKLEMDDVCSFTGFLPVERVISIMKQADLFVFPSNPYEGWGAVVNEAMSCRCCVIGNPWTGAVPWLIQDGVSGLHFDGKSTQDLSEKILYCLTHPEHRQAMGHKARETITNLWSPDVAAERFLALCTWLAQGGDATALFTDDGPCVSV